MNKVVCTELADLVYDYKHNAPLSVYSSLIMCAVIGLIVLISFIGSTIIDSDTVNFITLFLTILYILILIKFRPFTAKINIDEGRHLRDPDRIVSYILSKQSGDKWLYSIFMNIEKAFSKEFGKPIIECQREYITSDPKLRSRYCRVAGKTLDKIDRKVYGALVYHYYLENGISKQQAADIAFIDSTGAMSIGVDFVTYYILNVIRKLHDEEDRLFAENDKLIEENNDPEFTKKVIEACKKNSDTSLSILVKLHGELETRHKKIQSNLDRIHEIHYILGIHTDKEEKEES